MQISAAQASCPEAAITKIAESFSSRLSELLHDAPPDTDVNTQWQHITHSLQLGKTLDTVDSRSRLVDIAVLESGARDNQVLCGSA